ncbi:MAG TPA: hypothetical protein VJS42_19640 [Steroidobacteraceae bacterium]|nr:hypothetical protein [Steroidobacteraceae bacterium]
MRNQTLITSCVVAMLGCAAAYGQSAMGDGTGHSSGAQSAATPSTSAQTPTSSTPSATSSSQTPGMQIPVRQPPTSTAPSTSTPATDQTTSPTPSQPTPASPGVARSDTAAGTQPTNAQPPATSDTVDTTDPARRRTAEAAIDRDMPTSTGTIAPASRGVGANGNLPDCSRLRGLEKSECERRDTSRDDLPAGVTTTQPPR